MKRIENLPQDDDGGGKVNHKRFGGYTHIPIVYAGEKRYNNIRFKRNVRRVRIAGVQYQSKTNTRPRITPTTPRV